MVMTRRLCFSISASVLGSSIPIGYNYGIVNSPEDVLKTFIRDCISDKGRMHPPESLVTTLFGVMVASYSIGSVFGGPLGGYLSPRLGRKGTILAVNPIIIVGSLLQIASKYVPSLEMLIVGRFLAGITAGAVMVAQPMFLSETAPKEKRGFCGTTSQVCMAVGVTLAHLFGMSSVLGTKDSWQFAFGFTLIPALFQLCTMPFVPETPRFILMNKHNEPEARKALEWLRPGEDVDHLIEEMHHENVSIRLKQKFQLNHFCRNVSLRKRIFLCSSLRVVQQFSGIYAVIYYSTGVFKKASFTTSQSQYATLGTSGVYTLLVMLCGFIVDHAGRRTLLLLGYGGMFVSNVLLTEGLLFQDTSKFIPYLCVVAVLLVRLFFAIGPASIPSFLAAEMFTQDARSAALTIVVISTRLANIAVALMFPILKEAAGAYSFTPFILILAVYILYLQYALPETKGKTYKQIEEMFSDDEEHISQKYKCDADEISLLNST